MNTVFSRRQMLAATACSLIAPTVASANAILEEKPQIVRQIAEWNVYSIHLKCWFEGLAADVSQAVEDAQSIWSDRVLDTSMDFTDLESLLFKNYKQRGLPTMSVGCATSSNLKVAAHTAYIRSGGNSLLNTGKYEYGGWVLVSAPESMYVESRSCIRSWALQHLPCHSYFETEALVDHNLSGGKLRVTVVMADKH
ncbi:hypothetical protein [Variovorax sp. PCZ-1]|uniref:hypothetical protein n=1 Tax=Variovorax sp. PCZ-1 TaxID=2835533 RepID=UPI001BCC55EB|nr:hypothetical protein [Variovorax sp. PCZ-1]MBS7809245.1 hypothetical protein [Variovorax sp. PCZ-1]